MHRRPDQHVLQCACRHVARIASPALAACEAKLVRVTAGAILDVIVDARAAASAAMAAGSAKRRAQRGQPQAALHSGRFAHGFQTLVADTEVLYHLGALRARRPRRHSLNDRVSPSRGSDPSSPIISSERDAAWPSLARLRADRAVMTGASQGQAATVFGANGFVGRALTTYLRQQGL